MRKYRVIITALMLLFLSAGLAGAEEFYPPQRDGKGVIGGRNGEAWRLGIFETVTVSAGITPPVETVTAANVITAAECGTTFFLNSATEFASTLPAISTVSSGCEFTFIVKAAASFADYTVLTGNSLENVIYGSMEVAGAVVPCAQEDTITLVDGNAIGDWVKVVSDGAAWYISGSTVTAAKATCSQAD